MGKVKLSILVCTLEERRAQFDILKEKIEGQLTKHCELLYERDNRELSVGAKRNALWDRAKGTYVCFIDDDDDISDDYVELILKALESDPDCVGLIGIITQPHQQPKTFTHSVNYINYIQGWQYFRPPNHLNPIKKELIEGIRFAEKNHGEDTDWCMEIVKAERLKTEVMITKPIYFYHFDMGKSATVGR